MKRNKPTMRRWIYALFIAALCGNIAACGDKDESRCLFFNFGEQTRKRPRIHGESHCRSGRRKIRPHIRLSS